MTVRKCAIEMVHFDGTTTVTWTYGYNDFNQLTTLHPEKSIFTYDDNGNMIRRDNSGYGNADIQWDYNHNRENRLISVENDVLSELVTYTYDALGRRIMRTAPNGDKTKYYCDGLSTLMTKEMPSAGSTWRTKQVYTLKEAQIGQIIAEREMTAWDGSDQPTAWPDLWFYFDLLGNTVALTDDTGTAVAQYEQEAFGNVVSGQHDHYHLTTKKYDVDAKLYQIGARWYDGQSARWLEREPTGIDGPNLYHFVYNSPTNLVDFNGRDAHVVIYPEGWRHHQICFDNGDGTVNCYDLDVKAGEHSGGRIHWPWGRGSVGKQRRQLTDFPANKIITYPRTSEEDAIGRAWGDSRYNKQDRCYKFPFEQCWTFAYEGVNITDTGSNEPLVIPDNPPFSGSPTGPCPR